MIFQQGDVQQRIKSNAQALLQRLECAECWTGD